MVQLFAVLALSAVPGQVKLASPGLTGVQVPKDSATFYSDHLAQQIALHGFAVMTATEISSLLGLERQKQLLGCSSESSSCMAELADALGVDGIVTGSLAKLGDTFQIDVKVVASNNGRTLGIFSGTAKGDRNLLSVLTDAAALLSDQVLDALHRRPVATVSASGGVRRLSIVPILVGAIGIVAGAVLLGLVSGHQQALLGSNGMPSTLSYAQAMNELQVGSTEQAISITAFAVGAVALLAGGAMFLFGAPVAAAPTVSNSGAGVTLVTRWP
jgi:hypothetical protein